MQKLISRFFDNLNSLQKIKIFLFVIFAFVLMVLEFFSLASLMPLFNLLVEQDFSSREKTIFYELLNPLLEKMNINEVLD